MKGIQLEFEDLYKRSLFEKILNSYNLRTAFSRVKKNKGAPGIDGITIGKYEQNLEENLSQLRQEVQSWTYKPTPVSKKGRNPKAQWKRYKKFGNPNR